MIKEGFIAVGYQDKERVRPALDVIARVLEAYGVKPVLCVDDPGFDPESMKEVLEKVVACDVFIAEGSRKRIGVGIEAGTAYCNSKRIIYVHQRDAEESKTLRGISDHEIVYDSAEDLGRQLHELLGILIGR